MHVSVSTPVNLYECDFSPGFIYIVTVYAYMFILVFRVSVYALYFCAKLSGASVCSWHCERALFCVEMFTR